MGFPLLTVPKHVSTVWPERSNVSSKSDCADPKRDKNFPPSSAFAEHVARICALKLSILPGKSAF